MKGERPVANSSSNPATADELRALATKAITDLWVLVGGQQTEIERLTRELAEERDMHTEVDAAPCPRCEAVAPSPHREDCPDAPETPSYP